MQELTSAVSEEEVIHFFMNVIVPHVMKYQKSAIHMKPAILGASGQTVRGKEEFIERLESKLEFVATNTPKEQV